MNIQITFHQFLTFQLTHTVFEVRNPAVSAKLTALSAERALGGCHPAFDSALPCAPKRESTALSEESQSTDFAVVFVVGPAS